MLFFVYLQIQISSLCMCVILSATVCLCCLFMPKMYIVLLHPEKYARAMPGEKNQRSNSGAGGANNTAGSVVIIILLTSLIVQWSVVRN